MILITGLGNPGEKYSNTRHNVGFMFVDWLAQVNNLERLKFDKYSNAETIKNCPLATEKSQILAVLAKPQTYMNRSGESIKRIMTDCTIDPGHLIVIHDDLDIELGKFKIQLGVGPKKHNGIASIEEHLKTPEFWRVRIGVDNRQGDRTLTGETYVLQNFSQEEKNILVENFPTIFHHLQLTSL